MASSSSKRDPKSPTPPDVVAILEAHSNAEIRDGTGYSDRYIKTMRKGFTTERFNERLRKWASGQSPDARSKGHEPVAEPVAEPLAQRVLVSFEEFGHGRPLSPASNAAVSHLFAIAAGDDNDAEPTPKRAPVTFEEFEAAFGRAATPTEEDDDEKDLVVVPRRVPRSTISLDRHSFSGWTVLILPVKEDGYVKRLNTRSSGENKGFRLADLDGGGHVPDLGGVYEMAVSGGAEVRGLRVVYVGMTEQKDGLRGRLEQYATRGSHLRERINEAIDKAQSLWVRWKVIMGSPEAEEDYYLRTYDYEWNTMKNV